MCWSGRNVVKMTLRGESVVSFFESGILFKMEVRKTGEGEIIKENLIKDRL